MRWRESVLSALRAYADRHATRIVDRPGLIAEHLDAIRQETGSRGATPEQTLNYYLQRLRDEGLVEFVRPGRYLLLDRPLPAEQSDWDGETLTTALRAGRLTFGDVPAGDAHLPRADAMARDLALAGAPTRPQEIGVTPERLRATTRIAGAIRSRYTVLDLLGESGLLDRAVGEALADAAWGPS